jgi:hypothetical protein
MALSYEQFFGTGSQKLFTFAFDYLSRAHVKASVNGVNVPFNWVGTYSVELPTVPGPNSVVELRRITPRVERLVRFTDGSTLVATDMNTSTLQAFFLAQEAFDQGAASMAVTEDGQYSAQTRRITQVANPVNAQDVVTKGWAETAMSSQLVQANAARDQSVTAKNASEGANAAGQQARTDAIAARDSAIAARDSASGHRLNAQNAQAAAEAARDTSVTKASEASGSAAAALASKNEAATSKTAAEAARDRAEQAAGIREKPLSYAAQTLAEADKAQVRTNIGVGDAWDKKALVITGQNLNTLTSQGVYNGSDLVNAPVANWLFVEVMCHSNGTGYVNQIATDLNIIPTRRWTREANNGNWSSWRKLQNGNTTVSSAGPSGGQDGDIWYQV